MPGGDRTGPNGMGPMTGRGLGRGAGSQMPGSRNAGRGQGMGMGRGGSGGGRRGFRGMDADVAPQPDYSAPPDADVDRNIPVQAGGISEFDALRTQIAQIAQALEDITGKIERLEQKNKTESAEVYDEADAEK